MKSVPHKWFTNPTETEAIDKITREERQRLRHKKKEVKFMKTVFICSRYRADWVHTVEEAVSSALFACSQAVNKGYAPLCPHAYIPRCLSGDCVDYTDDNPEGRAAGMTFGREMLRRSDEVWVWGKTVTEGMAEEIALAKQLGKPIKVFNTIGIPQQEWNTEKIKRQFDNVTEEFLAEYETAEKTEKTKNFDIIPNLFDKYGLV